MAHVEYMHAVKPVCSCPQVKINLSSWLA